MNDSSKNKLKISKSFNENNSIKIKTLNKKQKIIGTPDYISPEILKLIDFNNPGLKNIIIYYVASD